MRRSYVFGLTLVALVAALVCPPGPEPGSRPGFSPLPLYPLSMPCEGRLQAH